MDLSLDEIIKKKNVKGQSNPRKQNGLRGQRSSGQRNSGQRISSGSKPRPIKTDGIARKEPRRTSQRDDKSKGPLLSKNGPVVDARMKIIQKNRSRLKDARDKLAELAKKTDARNKIRSRNAPQYVGNRRERVQMGRERMQVGRERAQMGRERVHMDTRSLTKSISNPPSALLQRSFRNNIGIRESLKTIPDSSSLLRCTINRPVQEFQIPSLMDLDVGMPLATRPRAQLSNLRVVSENQYNHYQDYPSPEPLYREPQYDLPMFMRHEETTRSGMRMSQKMRSRLDTPRRPSPQFSYTPPSPPPPPPPPQGYRIIVSNLHPSVTDVDIKELFEDIGELITSRLVRPGTAEVIYKFQRAAKKAVEAYHNRQLDGQPMKCLLVNPMSAPPTGSSGILRSNSLQSAPKFPGSSKSNVVPDVSAIHKALFTFK